MEKNKRPIIHIFLGMIIYFFILVLNSPVSFFISSLFPNSEIWRQTVKAVLYSINLILPSVYISLMLHKKISFRNSGALIKNEGIRKRIYLLTVPLTLTAVSAAGYITSTFAPKAENDYPLSAGAIALMFFNYVLLPALLEEILFRGLIMNSLMDISVTYAVGISSLFFALIHINIYSIPYALTAGIFIGIFTAATGSLRLAVICHFINNLRSYIFYIMTIKLEYPVFRSITLLVDLIIAAAAIVITFVTIQYRYKSQHGGEANAK